MLLARIDEYGKAAWLGLAVLAFLTAWPLGLAIFAFLVASGRTRAWQAEARRSPGRWFNLRGPAERMANRTSAAVSHPSGDEAFKAYRIVELDQLHVQEKESRAFLNRLCLARDKEEFDSFLAEQRRAMVGQPFSDHHGS